MINFIFCAVLKKQGNLLGLSSKKIDVNQKK